MPDLHIHNESIKYVAIRYIDTAYHNKRVSMQVQNLVAIAVVYSTPNILIHPIYKYQNMVTKRKF